MNEGDVVLASLIQANGNAKIRPLIYLREIPPYGDFLVCGISTQLHQQVKDFDELITKKDIDFEESGLIADSVIRLGFLSVLPRKNIVGTIGRISSERHSCLLKRLSNYLTRNINTK